MKANARWEEAQQTEVDFWSGMAQLEHGVLAVLSANCMKAELLKRNLPSAPRTALEIGTGPFGLGVIGFLQEIPFRVATDPLPPTPLDGANLLRRYIAERRSAMHYIVACGEEMPVRSESLDLVICCNVIDHSSEPDTILQEAHRVLKPGGLLFLDVDTFSVLGLLKWHLWTKHKHKDEMLVKSHPYRMFEYLIRRKLESHGFHARKVTGHSLLNACIGHFKVSSFLGTKRTR